MQPTSNQPFPTLRTSHQTTMNRNPFDPTGPTEFNAPHGRGRAFVLSFATVGVAAACAWMWSAFAPQHDVSVGADKVRPALVRLAQDVSGCIGGIATSKDADRCIQKYFYHDAQEGPQRKRLFLLAKRIHSSLGRRLDGKAIDQPLRWQPSPDVREPRSFVSMSIDASYENDGAVTERYVFVRSADKSYRVQSFDVVAGKVKE